MQKYWLKQNYQLAKAYIDWALGAPKLHRRFFRNHGYELNLENPQTFSEKIQWRKLYDKNPLFPILSNKYLVREYIADRLGQERAEKLLVPLLQYAEHPKAIDFSALPAQFVLKATHGSSMNLVVEDAARLDHEATRQKMRKWLIRHYGVKNHEWVYNKTHRGILVEELVALPHQITDVKFFCFEGEVRGIFLNEYPGGITVRTHFDASGRYLDVRTCGRTNNPDAKIPDGLQEMVALAKILSQGFDFIRVDFICTKDRFYIGELTVLHLSGYNVFDPPVYDQELGSYWAINPA